MSLASQPDDDDKDDAPDSKALPLVLPRSYKWLLTVMSLSLACFVLSLIISAKSSPEALSALSGISPASLLIFSLGTLIFAWTPWEEIGLSITKVGPIEFQRIINKQSTEHAQEIADLGSRIEALENHIHKNNAGAIIQEVFLAPSVSDLLLKFLSSNSHKAFSPQRIRYLSSFNSEFSPLTQYETPVIRRTLQKLVASGNVTTTVSRDGNTLYKMKNS
ncbi:hypothetical protein [Chitinimonas sp. BJYL2]|uniref:hypothetical protein n=1 Tax=Chitinimonas sp. BJYL2 TaxID=2976696 RepID=UPI0022B343FA|nr:hypothetical protein [Chitinimonas sp. BJYL2]